MGWRILKIPSAAVLAFMAIGACANAGDQRAKPITKIEARSLPSGVLVRRTLDQLADILSTTVRGSAGVRPQNVLTYLWFNSSPRATEVDGLCQHDALIVDFGHTARHSVDSDTPTRAVGLSATSFFLFLALPKQRSTDNEGAVATDLQDRCAKLSTDDMRFFAAESAHEAQGAIRALLAVQSSLHSGQYDFKVDCGETGPCIGFLKDFDVTDISSVADCKQVGDPGECWSFQSGFYRYLEIKTVYGKGTASVKTGEDIVLVHEPID